MFIQVSRSATVLIDAVERVRGRNNILPKIPKRMVRRTAKVKVKKLAAIQKAFDLRMVTFRILNDDQLPVKFSWAHTDDFTMEYAAGS